MSVNINVDFNPSNTPVAILAADTTAINRSGIARYAVTACSLHNTTGAGVTISVYISPDLTSASGVLVDTILVGANARVDVESILGQGYPVSRNVIMVGSAIGVNVDSSGHEYIGE